MNRRTLLFLLPLLLWTGLTWGQDTGLVTLQHRPAEEVLPLLRPLLGPGESVTGEGMQVILRAPTGALGRLAGVVRRLDRPARLLRLTLRRGEAAVTETNGGRRYHAGGEPLEEQALDTLEGREVEFRVGSRKAELKRGYAAPWAAGVEMEERSSVSRLALRAWLVEGAVTARVETHHQRPAAAGGVRVESLTTTVRGAPGAWLRLAGPAADERGSYRTRPAGGAAALWLRVEEIVEP